MADNAEVFDRAPGAGRTRGKASGPGQGESIRPREPELADGEAVFSHCQPLRQPRTPVPVPVPVPNPECSGDVSSSHTGLYTLCSLGLCARARVCVYTRGSVF